MVCWVAREGVMGWGYNNKGTSQMQGIQTSAVTKVVYYTSNLRCCNLRTIQTFKVVHGLDH